MPGRDFRSFLSRKFRTLLIPYAIFGAFHYVLWFVRNLSKTEDLISPLMHLLFINTRGLPITAALWFLTATFITQLVYYVLARFIRNSMIMHIAVITISMIGILFPCELPWAARAGLSSVGLYHVGHLFVQYNSI